VGRHPVCRRLQPGARSAGESRVTGHRRLSRGRRGPRVAPGGDRHGVVSPAREEPPELFSTPAPLAARMRPRTLPEFAGQEHLLAPGRALGDALRRGDLGSAILWGPPGTGKTSLAHLIAQHTGRAFVAFSAVTEGVQRVREIIKEAEERRRLGRGTILFCDEIHRFNRAQQDAFLPHVEKGTITLIGATTENPSFSLNSALLSRCQVFVLEPLAPAAIEAVARAALGDAERGLGGLGMEVDADGIAWLAVQAD